MAAPAPEPDVEAAPAPAPPPAPALPPPLSEKHYTKLMAVACSTCHRVLSATFNPGENRMEFTCPNNDEDENERFVPNLAVEAYLVRELEQALLHPAHAVLPMHCPVRNDAARPCEGTKCTLYKTSDGNGKKQFLVCHTCKKFWRVV